MTNKKNTPTISLIVCCYNISDYISEMLNSLLQQKYSSNKKRQTVANSDDVEILLIEDCSTDKNKTLKICERFKSKYSNIRLIKHKKNKGLSAARNTGIKNAKGKYISFPDPDDILAPGIIDKYFTEINKNDYDCIIAGVTERHMDQNNNLILENEIALKTQSLKSEKSIAKASIELEKKVCFGYAWNKLYKKEIIDKHSIYFKKDLLYIEDLLFNIEFFKKCKTAKILNCSAVIYNRRLKNKQSITSNYIENYFELHYLRIEELYNYWNEYGVLDKHAKEILGALYLRYTLSALWRNKDKKSNMSLRDQKIFINNFYDLEITKILLPYAKSDSLKNNLIFAGFKTKFSPLVLIEASLINFTTKYMNKTLTKARQKR